MGWPCKLCSAVVPAKTDILKHYRLHHGTFGHSQALPCIHIDCPCSFKNWSSLHCHLSRQHPAVDSLNSPQVTLFFTCLLCQKTGFHSEKEFSEHIGHHLKNNETVKWRLEVVAQCPDVAKFQERWPALFEPFQINEEFRRCTAVPLESVFMSQLDKYSPKLLDLFSAKSGAVGQRIKNLLMELIQDPSTSVVKKRDVTLRCLIEYMGESGQELISD